MALGEVEELESGGLPDFLRDPWGTLRRRWPWMVLALVIGLAGTAFVALRHEPVYSSTATVLVTSQQIRQDLVRPTVAEDSFQRIDALTNALLSMTRLSELIEEFDLYPDLREIRTLSEVVAHMRGSISIRALKGIGQPGRRGESARVFAITFENRDPKATAAVANSLAGQFTTESIRMRTQQASLATNFLKVELVRAEASLREQNSAIREFKEQHRGELPAELGANLMKLERLQQQRQSLALQIADAENRLILLAQQQAVTAAGGDSALLATPDQRLLGARSQLPVLLAEFTEKHPEVVLLRRSIKRLEAEVEAQLEAQLAAAEDGSREADPALGLLPAAARLALEQLRKQLASVEEALVDLDARVTRTPARQESLAALEERESILRESYLGFLRKVQQAELAQSLEAAQQGARFSISDRAVPPTQPTQARLKYTFVGVLGSFALAVAMGLLFEAIDPVLVSKDQIEGIADLRVLGTAPRLA